MFHLDGSEACWLIYADWLDDHDQPEKACLIRGQIQNKKHKERYTLDFTYACYVGSPWQKNGEKEVGFNFLLNAIGIICCRIGGYLAIGGAGSTKQDHLNALGHDLNV